MAVTTLDIDDRSRQAIDEIRRSLGASSNVEVIRRALALLREAAKTADDGGQIVLRSAQGTEREVLLR